MQFDESNRLKQRAKRLIPGGAHTYSKGDDQFPRMSPAFFLRGQGAYVWDPDGNEYLDWGMGLRSVCLGHAYQPVLDSVKEELEKGVNFSRPTPIEGDLAELLVDLIPCAEMVKLAKNGSDVTSAAVRLARAYTGRDIVIRCLDQPFFSVDDWFIGDTVMDAGIPDATKSLTKHFHYNNSDSLEKVLDEHSGNVACVILEAAATAKPDSGFLESVRGLTLKHNVVLIFDEIITGFRWDLRGAQHFYRIIPDLATFGKAIANGFALSALVGKKDIMKLGGLYHSHPRVFLLSTTYGGETHSIAAAIKTIETLSDKHPFSDNWNTGRQLITGFNSIAQSYGISDRAIMGGVEVSPWYAFYDKDGKVDLALRTLFLQETIRQGVFIPYISISVAHRKNEVLRTLEAFEEALKVVAHAMEKNSVEGLLSGPVVKPVFRKFN